MFYKKRCGVVTAIIIAYCLIFWWKCLLRFQHRRKFVLPFQLSNIKKKSLDKNMNVLNQWFPTGVPRHPRVPFTIPRGAAS